MLHTSAALTPNACGQLTCGAVLYTAKGAGLLSQVICFSSVNRIQIYFLFCSGTFVVVYNTLDHLQVL